MAMVPKRNGVHRFETKPKNVELVGSMGHWIVSRGNMMHWLDSRDMVSIWWLYLGQFCESCGPLTDGFEYWSGFELFSPSLWPRHFVMMQVSNGICLFWRVNWCRSVRTLLWHHEIFECFNLVDFPLLNWFLPDKFYWQKYFYCVNWSFFADKLLTNCVYLAKYEWIEIWACNCDT